MSGVISPFLGVPFPNVATIFLCDGQWDTLHTLKTGQQLLMALKAVAASRPLLHVSSTAGLLSPPGPDPVGRTICVRASSRLFLVAF